MYSNIFILTEVYSLYVHLYLLYIKFQKHLCMTQLKETNAMKLMYDVIWYKNMIHDTCQWQLYEMNWRKNPTGVSTGVLFRYLKGFSVL